MKILMTPHIDDFKEHESGIRRVIEAYFTYLPDFGIELVKNTNKYDLRAVHAGMTGRECDIAHLHGMYWTADYAAPSWEYHANELIVKALRNSLAVTVPSLWVAETLQRDMRISPQVIPHGIEWTEWHPQKHEGYVLWNKNRNIDVCDPTPAIEMARLRGSIELVTTFLPFGMKEKLSNVRGVGLLKHGVMKKFIERAMVYLSTTKETFGIGVLEAMAAGVPILGFDWGGNQDLIQHGVNGYLAKPNDIEDLANGLDYCIRYRKTLGDNSREMAKRWNWPDAVKLVADVYKLAMQSDPGQGKVSVVVPCYNYADLLERTIASVQNQTLQPDKIVIVNDGSTDNTDEIGRRLAQEFPNVHYIHQNNAGVAIARNAGIELCDSEYICCLDADDQLEHRFLEACVVALNKDRSLGIAYTGLTMLREDGKTTLSQWPTQPDYDKQLLARSKDDKKGKNQIPTCNVFRRKAWKRTGGYKQRYAPLGAGAEDGEFWARIMSIGYGAQKVSDAGLFIYDLGGRVSKPFADGSIDKSLLEPDWLSMHPWSTDKQHPFASRATPENNLSHPVRQYDQPDVSVIIPVGPGHEKLVENALDSLESQTFRRWEVIVVWDGRTNKTGDATDIVVGWGAYPYVRNLFIGGTKEHTSIPHGAGYARNRGAEMARAPFLVFLDADDSLAPTFLERCIDNWKTNKTIGYTDYISKAIVAEEDLDQFPQKDIISYLPKTQELLLAGRSADYNCERAQAQPTHDDFFHWCLITTLIPKSWHDKVGGFDEKMETFEDVLYHWAMARHGFCYSRIPEELVVYRMHTGNRRELASMYTDEGRHKARTMLEYAQTVLERIETMSCKKCPGGQPKQPINVFQEMGSLVEKEIAMAADSEMFEIEYTSPNIGNHHVVGAATGMRYGYRGGGTTFFVHKSDIEAQPHLYRKIQGNVPAPIEPTKETVPPVPIAVPLVTPPAPTVAPTPATNGNNEVPEYIAPKVKLAEQPRNLTQPNFIESGFVASADIQSNIDVVAGDVPQIPESKFAPRVIVTLDDEDIDLEAIPGITTNIAKELKLRGYITKAKIVSAGLEGLMEISGIGETRAEAIMSALAIDAREAI